MVRSWNGLRWLLALALAGGCRSSGALLVPESGDVDFGEVLLGDSRSSQYTVKAEGGTVEIETFVVEGPDAASFRALGLRGRTLADGESDRFTVVFRPLAEGALACDLNVRLLQGADGLFPAKLKGKGATWISKGGLTFVVPEADAALDFGVVPKNQIRDMRVKVKNTSARAIPYRVVVIDATRVFFHVGTDDGTLNAGETLELILRFQPAEDGKSYVRAAIVGSMDGSGDFAGITLIGREGRPSIPVDGFPAGE